MIRNFRPFVILGVTFLTVCLLNFDGRPLTAQEIQASCGCGSVAVSDGTAIDSCCIEVDACGASSCRRGLIGRLFSRLRSIPSPLSGRGGLNGIFNRGCNSGCGCGSVEPQCYSVDAMSPATLVPANETGAAAATVDPIGNEAPVMDVPDASKMDLETVPQPPIEEE